jgi:hypothetical protein
VRQTEQNVSEAADAFGAIESGRFFQSPVCNNYYVVANTRFDGCSGLPGCMFIFAHGLYLGARRIHCDTFAFDLSPLESEITDLRAGSFLLSDFPQYFIASCMESLP